MGRERVTMRTMPLRTALAVLFCATVVFAAASVLRGTDANWDLRNYHLYAPFAVWQGKLGLDLVPAQLQTFLCPTLDLLTEPFRILLNAHPAWLAALLAVPNAVGATLAVMIAYRLLPETAVKRLPLALLAGLFGATGVAGVSELGTSLGDVPPAALVLAAVLVLLPAMTDPSRLLRRAVAGGLALGAATGLKLSVAPLCIGLPAALMLCPPASFARRVAALGVFCLAAAAAAIALAGWWWWLLYSRFGSPLFPYYNDIFHSPLYFPAAVRDLRFMPHGLAETLLYPFVWALRPVARVTELPIRDPRFALAWLAVLVGVMQTLMSLHPRWRTLRPSRPAAFLLVFFVVSFVLWEIEFAILRYIVALELLTGAVLVVPLLPLLARGSGAAALLPAGALAALWLLALRGTITPDWGHVPFGARAVDVAMPTLPAGSTVILLNDWPMAYLAAFAPPDVRFIGANNNLVQPGQDTGLNHMVAAAVRAASDPLWGIGQPGAAADATLRTYRLQREGPCQPIHSNLDDSAIDLCRLHRVP